MILPKIKVLRSHSTQYIPDLKNVTLTDEFRGRPELTATDDMSDVEAAAAICPTRAITAAPFTLDLGRCLFCGECARRAPRNIRFTNDYRLGSPTRRGLVLHPGMERVPRRMAIARANRAAVDGASYLIAYAVHAASNARALTEYARRREARGLITVTALP